MKNAARIKIRKALAGLLAVSMLTSNTVWTMGEELGYEYATESNVDAGEDGTFIYGSSEDEAAASTVEETASPDSSASENGGFITDTASNGEVQSSYDTPAENSYEQSAETVQDSQSAPEEAQSESSYDETTQETQTETTTLEWTRGNVVIQVENKDGSTFPAGTSLSVSDFYDFTGGEREEDRSYTLDYFLLPAAEKVVSTQGYAESLTDEIRYAFIENHVFMPNVLDPNGNVLDGNFQYKIVVNNPVTATEINDCSLPVYLFEYDSDLNATLYSEENAGGYIDWEDGERISGYSMIANVSGNPKYLMLSVFDVRDPLSYLEENESNTEVDPDSEFTPEQSQSEDSFVHEYLEDDVFEQGSEAEELPSEKDELFDETKDAEFGESELASESETADPIFEEETEEETKDTIFEDETEDPVFAETESKETETAETEDSLFEDIFETEEETEDIEFQPSEETETESILSYTDGEMVLSESSIIADAETASFKGDLKIQLGAQNEGTLTADMTTTDVDITFPDGTIMPDIYIFNGMVLDAESGNAIVEPAGSIDAKVDIEKAEVNGNTLSLTMTSEKRKTSRGDEPAVDSTAVVLHGDNISVEMKESKYYPDFEKNAEEGIDIVPDNGEYFTLEEVENLDAQFNFIEHKEVDVDENDTISFKMASVLSAENETLNFDSIEPAEVSVVTEFDDIESSTDMISATAALNSGYTYGTNNFPETHSRYIFRGMSHRSDGFDTTVFSYSGLYSRSVASSGVSAWVGMRCYVGTNTAYSDTTYIKIAKGMVDRKGNYFDVYIHPFAQAADNCYAWNHTDGGLWKPNNGDKFNVTPPANPVGVAAARKIYFRYKVKNNSTQADVNVNFITMYSDIDVNESFGFSSGTHVWTTSDTNLTKSVEGSVDVYTGTTTTSDGNKKCLWAETTTNKNYWYRATHHGFNSYTPAVKVYYALTSDSVTPYGWNGSKTVSADLPEGTGALSGGYVLSPTYGQYTTKSPKAFAGYSVTTTNYTAGNTIKTNANQTLQIKYAEIKKTVTVNKTVSMNGIPATTVATISPANFKLQLKGTSLAGESKTYSATTNSSGAASFSAIQGSYTLSETGTPYASNTNGWTVSIPTPSFSVAGSNITKTVTNTLQKGSLTVTKAISDPAGLHPSKAGYVFQISGKPTFDSSRTITLTATTNANGTATFSNVPIGTYALTEKSVPSGLSKSSFTISGEGNVTITNGGTATKTVTNTYTKTNVNVTKTVSMNGVPTSITPAVPVNGFKIRLNGTQSAGGTLDKTQTTDANGKTTFTEVPYGSYTLSETGTAYNASSTAGWTVSFSNTAVGITSNAVQNRTVTNTLQKGSVTVNKTVVDPSGKMTGKSGFVFTLSGHPTFDTSRTITTTATTNANGVASFSNIPIGTYAITETSYPSGTTASEWTTTGLGNVTVTNGGTATLNVTNTFKTGTVNVTKAISDDSGEAHSLSGYTFTLSGNPTYNTSTTLTFTATTNASGVATFKVPAGTYTVTETGRPTGINANEWVVSGEGSVTVTNGGTVNKTITNTCKTYWLKFNKAISGETKPASGTYKFTLTSSVPMHFTPTSSNIVEAQGYNASSATMSSDKKTFTFYLTASGDSGSDLGTIRINGLRMGDYTLTEDASSVTIQQVLYKDELTQTEYASTPVTVSLNDNYNPSGYSKGGPIWVMNQYPEKGTLKVTKDVKVNGQNPTDDNMSLVNGTYTFEVFASNNGVKTGSVLDTITISITNGIAETEESNIELAPGTYIVSEVTTGFPAQMTVDANDKSVIVTAGKKGDNVQPSGIVTFTNDFEENYELNIEKVVVGDTAPTTDTPYTISVTSAKAMDLDPATDITGAGFVAGSASLTNNNKTLTFQIQASSLNTGNVSIAGLRGGSYTVSESVPANAVFKASYKGHYDADYVNAVKTISLNDAHAQESVSVKNAYPDRGTLKVTKTVKVNGQDPTASNMNYVNGTYTFEVYATNDGVKTGPVLDTITINITDGTPKTVESNVEFDAGTYVISEVTTGFPEEMTISGGNDKAVVVTAGNKGANVTSNGIAKFTNNYSDGYNLIVEKELTGDTAPNENTPYTITVNSEEAMSIDPSADVVGADLVPGSAALSNGDKTLTFQIYASSSSSGIVTVTGLAAGTYTVAEDVPSGANYTASYKGDSDSSYVATERAVSLSHSALSGSVSIKNTYPDKGTIKVTKAVKVNGNEPNASNMALVNRTYTFEVYASDDGVKTGSPLDTISIDITDGTQKTVESNIELEPGDYIISEVTTGLPAQMFIEGGNDRLVTVTSGKKGNAVLPSGMATFVNDYENYALNLNKVLEGDTAPATNTAYTVTVSSSEAMYLNPTTDITGSGYVSRSVAFSNGNKTLTFQIRANASTPGNVVISNLKAGDYTISESVPSGAAFTASYKEDNDANYTTALRTVSLDSTTTSGGVSIKNTYPDKGTLKVTKDVQVNGEAPTADNMSLVNGTYTFKVYATNNGAKTGSALDTITVNITDGQAETVDSNIEFVAGTYIISEVTDGLPQDMSITGGNDKTVVVTAGNKGDNVTQDAIAVFTNNYNENYKLNIEKVLTGDTAPTTDTNYTVTVDSTEAMTLNLTSDITGTGYVADSASLSNENKTLTFQIKANKNTAGSVIVGGLKTGEYTVSETVESSAEYSASYKSGSDADYSSSAKTFSLEPTAQSGSVSIKNTYPDNGTLKVTKSVTVNKQDPTPDKEALVNGIYTFEVYASDNGVKTGSALDTINVTISDGETNTVESNVEFAPGTYIVSEVLTGLPEQLRPLGGTDRTVVVTSGLTENDVLPTGIANFTNNYAELFELDIEKTLVGDTAPEANENFTVTIVSNDEMTLDPQNDITGSGYVANSATLSDGNKTLTFQIKANALDSGSVTVGGLTAGTYTVSETVPSGAAYTASYKKASDAEYSSSAKTFTFDGSVYSDSLSIKNTYPDRGTLKVTKAVKVNGEDPTEDTLAQVTGTYQFEVYATNEGVKTGAPLDTISINIEDGSAQTVESNVEFEEGTYIVKEVTSGLPSEMTVVDGDERTVHVVAGQKGTNVAPDAIANFTNNYIENYSLEIEKILDGLAAPEEDSIYTVVVNSTVEMDIDTQTDVAGSGLVSGSAVLSNNNKTLTFQIKANTTTQGLVTVNGLNTGSYTISETVPAESEYTAYYTSEDEADFVTTPIQTNLNYSDSDDSIVIKNQYPSTGTFKLTKAVTVSGNDPTQETMSLVNGTYTFEVYAEDNGEKTGDVLDTIVVNITDGTAKTVESNVELPQGTYIVSEVMDDLPEEIKVVDGNDKTVYVTAGKKGDKIIETGMVSFTNDYDEGYTIDVNKTLEGNTAPVAETAYTISVTSDVVQNPDNIEVSGLGYRADSMTISNDNKTVTFEITADRFNPGDASVTGLKAGTYQVTEVVSGTTYTASYALANSESYAATAPEVVLSSMNREAGIDVKNTYPNLKIIKADGKGNPVPDATLAIYKSTDFNVNGSLSSTATAVDSWQTDSTPHEVIDELDPDVTYVIVETAAPTGYGYTDNVQFKVGHSGDLAEITINDPPIEFKVNKYDEDGQTELADAVLELYNASDVERDGTPSPGAIPVGTWTSAVGSNYDFGSVMEAGASYVLYEAQAPVRHEKAENASVTVARDGAVTCSLTKDGAGAYKVIDPRKIYSSIIVTKTVAGNMGDKTKEFDFMLTLAETSTIPLPSKLIVSKNSGADEEVALGNDGTYAFKLAHGEQIEFKDLEAGTPYTVVELHADELDYKVTKENDTGFVGTSNVTVSFTNTRNLSIPTSHYVGRNTMIALVVIAMAIPAILYGRKKWLLK